MCYGPVNSSCEVRIVTSSGVVLGSFAYFAQGDTNHWYSSNTLERSIAGAVGGSIHVEYRVTDPSVTFQIPSWHFTIEVKKGQ